MENIQRNELLVQAVQYFSKPEFQQLVHGLRERYRALSRLGGNVQLNHLTKAEAEALEGFLQINIPEGSDISVSVRQIRKALNRTRYAPCSLEEILPLVLGKDIVSKKEEKAKALSEYKTFFDRISVQYQETIAGNWFDQVLAGSNSAVKSMFLRDVQNDRDWLAEHLPLILQGVNEMPALRGQYLRLPVFAAAVTGNPHYFDEGKRALTYLLYAIRDLIDQDTPKGDSREARAQLLYGAGILKDDLSNWVLCSGIQGYLADDQPHPGMKAYCQRGESQILTMQNLSLLHRVAITGKAVYVVENPAVFSWLVEQDQRGGAYVCSAGQLRLSVLFLLDLLAKNGVEIYYSGDFDPEGLCIAQKLISRYGSQLHLWYYREEFYHKAMSAETISERRLKQLARLKDEELVALGNLMKKEKRPGYQENIMAFIKVGDESQEQ